MLSLYVICRRLHITRIYKNKIHFLLFQLGNSFLKIVSYSEYLRNRRKENSSKYFQPGTLSKYKRRFLFAQDKSNCAQ